MSSSSPPPGGILAPLTVVLTALSSFFGAVMLVYAFNGGNTLTGAETIACAFLAIPPTLIVVCLLELLRRTGGRS